MNLGCVHFRFLDALFAGLIGVALKGNRRGARVMVMGQQFHGARSALGGDGDLVHVACHAGDQAQLLEAKLAEKRVHHLVTETHLLGQFKNRERSG